MDGAQMTGFSGGGSGAGGGPAPFLLKTYDMVDDSSTDHIVSWSPSRTSFIVWNPPEFSRLLLPTYFKHNNFSSFIRQLNTYGFHKIDPERWEFANEDFVKDRKHLLKNIHRRKPIHSHSHPHVDPDRAALDEEVDKLSREKAELQFKVKRVQQQKSIESLQLDELRKRLNTMKERQDNLLMLMEKAIEDPLFLEHLVCKIDSVDFTAYYKKRRLPQSNHFEPVAENNSAENQSTPRTDFVNVFPQDLTNKLTLELSPVVFDRNKVLSSTQSSDEGFGCSPTKLAGVEPRHVQMKPCSLQFGAEAMDLTDTGTSLTFQMDSALSLNVATKANSELQSLQRGAMASEEFDGHVSCQLNLTLASFSPFQVDPGQIPARVNQINEESIRFSDVRSDASGKSSDHGALSKNKNYADDDGGNLSSSQESPSDKQGPTTTPVRVNDVFWEQFLTERPGSSDTEEASSSYRAIPFDEQEDKGGSQGMSKTAKNLGSLTL